MVHIPFGNLLFPQDTWISLELLHSIPLHKPINRAVDMTKCALMRYTYFLNKSKVRALGKGREHILNPVCTARLYNPGKSIFPVSVLGTVTSIFITRTHSHALHSGTISLIPMGSSKGGWSYVTVVKSPVSPLCPTPLINQHLTMSNSENWCSTITLVFIETEQCSTAITFVNFLFPTTVFRTAKLCWCVHSTTFFQSGLSFDLTYGVFGWSNNCFSTNLAMFCTYGFDSVFKKKYHFLLLSFTCTMYLYYFMSNQLKIEVRICFSHRNNQSCKLSLMNYQSSICFHVIGSAAGPPCPIWFICL